MISPDKLEPYNKLKQAYIEKVNRLREDYRTKIKEIFSKHEQTRQNEIRQKLGI